MLTADITEGDEGKRLVYEDETVGRIVDVAEGTAYVDPDPEISERQASLLGGGGDGRYAADVVTRTTEEEVRLRVEAAT